MGRIALDANVFLSVLLPESTLTTRENIEGCERILRSIGKTHTAVTSTIVLAEVAWAFLRERKEGIELEAAREVIEEIPGLKLVPVDTDIAFSAGKLRKKYYSKELQISYQDAIYLVTSLREEAEIFYTTDTHLLRLKEKIKIREPKDFK